MSAGKPHSAHDQPSGYLTTVEAADFVRLSPPDTGAAAC